jgi:histone-lysine N-methyltransferase EZH2
MDTSSPSDPDPEDSADHSEGIKALVSSVYQSVWREYSSWDRENCQKTLHDLSRRGHRETSHTIPLQSGPRRLRRELKAAKAVPAQYEESFEVWDIRVDATPELHMLHISATDVVKAAKTSKSPSYESCTPVSRNIMVGDDSDYMPFIPNADDPTYDNSFDIAEHKYFAWQQPDTVEPDCANYFYPNT